MGTGPRTQPSQRRGLERLTFDVESLALFGSLYHTALRMTRSAADAEDLTQETYARALGASGSFRTGTNLKAWLFTILRNINRNRIRDRRRAIVVVDGARVDQFGGADPSTETPESSLIRKASSDDLRAAIASLPRALGTAVWLRDIEGLSYAEIAKRLDIPVGTVMSRLSSGRARLYRRLSGNSTFAGRWRR